jgi:CHAD domain-containing protein
MAGQLLSEQERKLLEEHKNNSSGIQQRRSHLILLYDDGLLTHQAAEQAGFSRSQARFWKHQFLMNGMAIFPELQSKPAAVTELGFDQVDAESLQKDEELEDVQDDQELPFPSPIKRPGILPTDTLAEAGRKTWLYLFSEMVDKEGPTKSGKDIEDLHDMRVATRRMRSAFDIYGQAFKKKAMKKHLAGLRSAGKALGRVRDMDVLLGNLDQYILTLDDARREGLRPLVDAWQAEREDGRQALLAHFNSLEYQKFKRDFNRFVQTPGEAVRGDSFSTITPRLVREIVPALIYERLGAVRAYDSILNNASDAQLHMLRIEFKKLRYTTEYFREVLGPELPQVIGDLKSVQDLLGNFHDAVVTCDLVRKFLKDWETNQIAKPLLERQNPEPVVTYLAQLHADRHALLLKLPSTWEHLNRPEFRLSLARAVAAL